MDQEIARRLRQKMQTCNVTLDEFVEIVRTSVPAAERQALLDSTAIYVIQTDRIDGLIEAPPDV